MLALMYVCVYVFVCKCEHDGIFQIRPIRLLEKDESRVGEGKNKESGRN